MVAKALFMVLDNAPAHRAQKLFMTLSHRRAEHYNFSFCTILRFAWLCARAESGRIGLEPYEANRHADHRSGSDVVYDGGHQVTPEQAEDLVARISGDVSLMALNIAAGS
jgi:hypothetical protein